VKLKAVRPHRDYHGGRILACDTLQICAFRQANTISKTSSYTTSRILQVPASKIELGRIPSSYLHEMRLLVRAAHIVLSVLLPALIMPLMIFARNIQRSAPQTLADTLQICHRRTHFRAHPGTDRKTKTALVIPGHSVAEILTDNPQNALKPETFSFYIRTQTEKTPTRFQVHKGRVRGVPLITVVYRGNQIISSNGRAA